MAIRWQMGGVCAPSCRRRPLHAEGPGVGTTPAPPKSFSGHMHCFVTIPPCVMLLLGVGAASRELC